MDNTHRGYWRVKHNSYYNTVIGNIKRLIDLSTKKSTISS